MSAAIDFMRRRRARFAEGVASQPGERVADPPAAAASPESELEQKELERVIDGAIARIHDTRRPVVRMYLRGHDRQEIARLMGWTEAKTRNLLYRGLAELREELQRMGIGPGVAG